MELNRIDNSAALLTLTLTADRIEEAYAKTMKDYAKKIVVNGFRQGKAPVSIIEKKYGDVIREESTFKLMEDNLQTALKELDTKDRPLPYSVPELQDEEKLLPFHAGQDITYTVKYDVLPQFTLPQYNGLEIEYNEQPVTDKMVEDEIEELRQQNALVSAVDDPVEDGSIVTMDYAELDVVGNEIESTKREDFTFTVGSNTDFYKIDKDIIGYEKGASVVLEKTYGDDSGMGTEYLGKTVKLRVTIKEIKRKFIPELDDDFAQDVNDNYNTMEDLRNGTRAKLQEEADEFNSDMKLDAVVKRLVNNTEIQVPQSMIQAEQEAQWREFAQRFGMSTEEVEKLMTANGSSKEAYLSGQKESVISKIKAQLIIDEVKNDQKIVASEEEIAESLTKYGDIEKDNPNYESFRIYAKDDAEFEKAKDYLIENNTFIPAVKKTDEAESSENTTEEKAEEN